MGKCKFSFLWLADDRVKSWLSPVPARDDRARCTACSVNFDVSNMGGAAVVSHMHGKKIKEKLENKAKSPMARFVLPRVTSPGSATSSSSAGRRLLRLQRNHKLAAALCQPTALALVLSPPLCRMMLFLLRSCTGLSTSSLAVRSETCFEPCSRTMASYQSSHARKGNFRTSPLLELSQCSQTCCRQKSRKHRTSCFSSTKA